jgi:single-stranded-DNA-specific exonuclease
MSVLDTIMAARGLTGEARERFLHPAYDAGHDPFLLPDMEPAVQRLVAARSRQERIVIYGDYDIDGLTATAVLLDALKQFGFLHVEAFIPNRFVEGYGMTVDAVDKIAAIGCDIIITVDCGSLSGTEIRHAATHQIDVIVTDHHNVAEIQPPAVAVINPKRWLHDYADSYEDFMIKPDAKPLNPPGQELYPFVDLPGVGVAFKLVQALQTRLEGLPAGQEKWLLDLVALGTVCDVVTLRDENRMHVYWGLKVLAQTRRPGLKALMAVAGIEPQNVTAKSLGFALGPRMNAAGRLETAQIALDMLTTHDRMTALAKAQQLDDMNVRRRREQDVIMKEAVAQAVQYVDDAVLVVNQAGWNHGIVGIVAAKLLEKFHKPTYVLAENGEEAKGSARSYGDFSAADAIRSAEALITKGGGHKLAAGVTLPTKNIAAFRKHVNQHYRDHDFVLADQQKLLLPKAETTISIGELVDNVAADFARLEPCGNGNPEPVLESRGLRVVSVRRMGSESQHVKLQLEDQGERRDFLAFNAPEHFFVSVGSIVTVSYKVTENIWRGQRSVEGYLLHIEVDSPPVDE